MNTRILLIVLSATFALSSCSVINKFTAPKKTDESTGVRTVTIKTKKGETPTVELPQAPVNNVQVPSPGELSGGEWNVVSVGEININNVDEVPAVNFDTKG